MEADSIFRFVAVRPPEIKLPQLDPPSRTDPKADAIVEQRMLEARAHTADEASARREAARMLREEDSLVVSASGRALLMLTAEAETIYRELPRCCWRGPFSIRMRQLLAHLPDRHGKPSDDWSEQLDELSLRTWLTYYSGLLDPNSEPWFEAARFWLRILNLQKHFEDLPDDSPPPDLAGIGLPAPIGLWRMPRASAREVDPPREIMGGDELARAAALARGRDLETLLTKLRHLLQRRQADLAAQSRPAAEAPEDSTGYLAATPLPKGPLPADPPVHELSEGDYALLTSIGIAPATTPLLRCIEGVLVHIAHLAADLLRVDSHLKREGRIYVRDETVIAEEPR